MDRRTFLISAAGAAAAQGATWQSGDVAHLLPTANDTRILLKASFRRKVDNPALRIGKKTAQGRPTGTQGDFWAFDIQGLAPAQPHTLEHIRIIEQKQGIARRACECLAIPVQGRLVLVECVIRGCIR